MKIPKILFISCVVFSCISAHADGIYLLGSAGQSKYKLSKDDFDNALRGAGAIGVTSTTHENDSAYKIQLGYQFTPNFALEAGYIDLGKARYTANFLGGSANASVKAQGVNVATLGIIPIYGSASLFAKVGVINAKANTNLSTSQQNVSIESTHLRANTGLGFNYGFTKSLGVRVEYEQFYKLGDTHGGTQRVDFWSMGIAYKF